MKICGISDFHGSLLTDIPKCDVLCLAGDIVPIVIQRDYNKSMNWLNTTFMDWCNLLDCKKIFVVPGNHDFCFEEIYLGNTEDYLNFKLALSTLSNGKVEVLIDETYTYEGVTFHGCPWINEIHYQRKAWAFEYNNETDEVPYTHIPECDILITHDNPNHNSVLWSYCKDKYQHHLFGHWHDGVAYGHLNQHNCAILDDYYGLKKEHKLVCFDYYTEVKDLLTKLKSKEVNED